MGETGFSVRLDHLTNASNSDASTECITWTDSRGGGAGWVQEFDIVFVPTNGFLSYHKPVSLVGKNE